MDVHLADGQLSSIAIDSARLHLDGYYQAIFNHYGIDSATFDRSIRYYAGRPVILNEIYDEVEKRLQSINDAQQQGMTAQYESRRAADSIQRIQRQDSIIRIRRDSIELRSKRNLLFLHSSDSLYGAPIPITYEALNIRLLEQLRLKNPGEAGASAGRTIAADQQVSTPATPVHSMPPTVPIKAPSIRN